MTQQVWKVTLTYPSRDHLRRVLGHGTILSGIRAVAVFLRIPVDIKVEAIVEESDYLCQNHSMAGNRHV